MLYSYSLPDLKCVGAAELGGMGAAWLTLTPDGKTAYVANAVTNDVSAVDIKSMKEVARIRSDSCLSEIPLGCSRNKIALCVGDMWLCDFAVFS